MVLNYTIIKNKSELTVKTREFAHPHLQENICLLMVLILLFTFISEKCLIKYIYSSIVEYTTFGNSTRKWAQTLLILIPVYLLYNNTQKMIFTHEESNNQEGWESDIPKGNFI